jgi:pimeloyl-ACP methyl ester carboxylesterase
VLQHRAHGLLLNVPFALIAGREDKLCARLSKTGVRMLHDIKNKPRKVKFTLYMASLLQRTPLRLMLLKFGGFAKVDYETQKLYKNKGGALNYAGREGNKRGLKGHFLDLQIMGMHNHETLSELIGTVSCKSVVWAGACDLTTPVEMAKCYVEELPDAKLNIVPDMGHFLAMKHSTDILKSMYES